MSIFVFELKTAYEMRISDCSSDVCSSDLVARHVVDERRDNYDVGLSLLAGRLRHIGVRIAGRDGKDRPGCAGDIREGEGADVPQGRPDDWRCLARLQCQIELARSEGSRVGKGCVSTLRSRGAPSH